MQKENRILLIALALAGAAYGGMHYLDHRIARTAGTEDISYGEYMVDPEKARSALANKPYEAQTLPGKYLAASFAQDQNDWMNAFKMFDALLKDAPDNPELQQRVMMLALGAGETTRAYDIAQKIQAASPNQPIVSVLLTLQKLQNKEYASAQKLVADIPAAGVGALIKPFLQAWLTAAADGRENTALLMQTGSYYHAFLVADFTNKRDAFLKNHARALKKIEPFDLERMGDILAGRGDFKGAENLYHLAGGDTPENERLKRKLDGVKLGQLKTDDLLAKPITSPVEGMAEALYDIGAILVREGSHETGHIFAQLARALAPDKTAAKVLLAVIAAKDSRYDDAIAFYRTVPETDADYLEVQQRIAEILEESDRSAEAIDVLKKAIDKSDDLETLMRLGDLYRHQENYEDALKIYNQAYEKLEGKVPADHWELLYARGMILERLKRWADAEKDLQAALTFQPDHPYVLNYLAYSWVDQGIKVEESLEMLKRAVRIKPDDGFITDSLGWAYYRAGKFDEAVEYLELAVALVPYDPVINDHLGDAYWQVGRKREAEFQWQRALNAKDIETELKTIIEAKLQNGLTTNYANAKQIDSLQSP